MRDCHAHSLYVAALQTIYDGEQRLVDALLAMAEAAGDTALQSVFIGHRGESDTHLSTLATILDDLDESAADSVNDAITALLRHGETIMRTRANGPARDAALLGIAWQIGYVEIAGYTTLIKLAARLGRTGDVIQLREALGEETAVNEALDDIATRPTPRKRWQAGPCAFIRPSVRAG